MVGTVLGGGGDEVSIMPFFTPVGLLASHNLVLFHMFILILNLIILPFLSLSENVIFNNISRRREGGI